jgi:NitT/TauT family transport system permease protein
LTFEVGARRRWGDAAAAASGLLLMLLAWQAAHARTGSLVLPSPLAVAARLADVIVAPGTFASLATTVGDALGGLVVGGAIGLVAGILAGAARPIGAALQPLATVLLGVPHIAWVVLALLWFGPQGMAPAFTVAVTSVPLLFVGACHGMRARDPTLAEMARVFALAPAQRLVEITVPQIATYVRAALAGAIGMSFKVAVMAEVLSGGSGVGGRIATARAYLETDLVLAWIVLTMALLLALEAALRRLAG